MKTKGVKYKTIKIYPNNHPPIWTHLFMDSLQQQLYSQRGIKFNLS